MSGHVDDGFSFSITDSENKVHYIGNSALAYSGYCMLKSREARQSLEHDIRVILTRTR